MSIRENLLFADKAYEFALVFRDAGPAFDKELWVALQELTGSITSNESEKLLPFLRDEDSVTTKQTALQGIQVLFGPEGARREVPHPVLQRVEALANRCFNEKFADTPEKIAMAANAYFAARLIGSSVVPKLDAWMEQNPDSSLTDQVTIVRHARFT